MLRFLLALTAVLMLALPMTAQVSAQVVSAQEPQKLKVATRVLEPFVVEKKGELTGFSIDLWRAIADRLKIETEFVFAKDVPSLLELVKSQQADLGIAAISVTAERDKVLDFSQPMMDSGLQILVRGDGGGGPPNPLGGLLRSVFSKAALVWLGIAALLIIIPAHIVWWLERKHPDGIVPAGEPYYPGILHALWWAAGTLATQGESMPRSWVGRIFAILWMFVGVIFVAYYTAQLTATLTVEQIQGAINGPEDLPGKKVGTIKGSTSATYLEELRSQMKPYEKITDAYGALLNREVDAVVFDSPVLLYYANTDGKGRAQVVGSVFRKQDYGIVFQRGSEWRKRVDGALLAIREDGTYQALHDKWFGVEGK
ncbi:MAG: transporter substrate-binding domain-containing protein [Hyphomicrobiaceae bacterium]|nr:transporter substrate-binding domain-containing protein [Hyphomicrobiaceae bacterium]